MQGVENPKILPRSKTISVIHSNEEASIYLVSMQYNLSLASAIKDTPQKLFCGVGWRFLDFRGGVYRLGVAVPFSSYPSTVLR